MKFLLENRGKLLEYLGLAELKILLAEPYFDDLYELQKAIQKAQGKSMSALKALKKRIKDLADVELKPKPLLNGHDLMRLGVIAGPRLGQIAAEMYIAQLEGTVKNEQDARLWVQKWLKKHRADEK